MIGKTTHLKSILKKKANQEEIPIYPLKRGERKENGYFQEEQQESNEIRSKAGFRQMFQFAQTSDFVMMAFAFLLTVFGAILGPIITRYMGPYFTSQMAYEAAKNANSTGEAPSFLRNVTVSVSTARPHGLKPSTTLAELFANDTWLSSVERYYNGRQQSSEVADSPPPLSEVELLKENMVQNSINYAILSIVLSCTTAVSIMMQRLIWIWTASRQVSQFRLHFMERLIHMDIEWLQQRSAAQVTATLSENLSNIYSAISYSTQLFITCVFHLPFTLLIAATIRYDVVLVLLPAVPLIIVFLVWDHSKSSKYTNAQQAALSDASQLAMEAFTNIKTVLSFNGQRQTIDKYTRHLFDAVRISRKGSFWKGFIEGLIEVVSSLIFVFGIWYATRTDADGDPGDTFVMPKIEHIQYRGIKPWDITGDVRLDNVSFRYASRPETQVLTNINLEVPAGSRIGVVGGSGSGKSTLAALILRFFDPFSGQVYLDEKDIRTLNVDWLRRQIGYVGQEPVLFNTTLRENIMCANPDATMADLDRALRSANVLEFISRFPDGIDTQAGERGVQLSGGQKQRIAIARALIRDPKILIFDEATSALDTASEHVVQQAIDKASHGRTSITIAHRLSTVMGMDTVVVMAKGTIVEIGSPTELLERKGRFYTMTQHQTLHTTATKIDSWPDHLSGYQSASGRGAQSDYDTAKSGCSGDTGTSKDQIKTLSTMITKQASESRAGSSYGLQRRKHQMNKQIRRKLSDTDSVVSYTSSIQNKPTVHYGMMRIHEADEDEEEEEELEKAETLQNKRSRVWSRLTRGSDFWRLLLCLFALTLRGACIIALALALTSQMQALTLPNEEMLAQQDLIASLWSVACVLQIGIRTVAFYITMNYGNRVTTNLQIELITHILSNNLPFFEDPEHELSILNARVTKDTASVRQLTTFQLADVGGSFVTGLLAALVSLIFSVTFTLIISGVYAFLFLLRSIEMRVTASWQKQLSKKEDECTKVISEALGNFTTIKAYSLQNVFYDRYATLVHDLLRSQKKLSLVGAACYGFQKVLMFVFYAAAVLTAAQFIANDMLTTGQMWGVCLMVPFGFARVLDALLSVNDLLRGFTSLNSIEKALSEPIHTNCLSDQGVIMPLKGNIRIKTLKFRYPNRPQVLVLNDLNLKVKSGQTVALVGSSGCGKSTVIQLLQRLYEPMSGKIVLDDYDIRDLNIQELRRCVVPVNQEPILFNTTVWENISYGLDVESISQQQIVQAAKWANIHDFIVSLPQGYNTTVGDLGSQLSGGQKQRIAIARALIRRPAVLLLDEATSALDSESERIVQETLDRATDQHTCITIAHRLSTIQNAHPIFVMRSGQVVEKGSHVHLITKGGLYQELCQNQMDMAS